MCTDNHPPAPPAQVLHDVEPGFEIDLEPVDSVVVTTLMDNVSDSLMADQGPAHRFGLGRVPWAAAAVMEEAQAPVPLDAFIPNSVGTSFHL